GRPDEPLQGALIENGPHWCNLAAGRHQLALHVNPAIRPPIPTRDLTGRIDFHGEEVDFVVHGAVVTPPRALQPPRMVAGYQKLPIRCSDTDRLRLWSGRSNHLPRAAA